MELPLRSTYSRRQFNCGIKLFKWWFSGWCHIQDGSLDRRWLPISSFLNQAKFQGAIIQMFIKYNSPPALNLFKTTFLSVWPVHDSKGVWDEIYLVNSSEEVITTSHLQNSTDLNTFHLSSSSVRLRVRKHSPANNGYQQGRKLFIFRTRWQGWKPLNELVQTQLFSGFFILFN